jgi:hypothetical protein
MTFEEFLAKKVATAQEYACGITADEEDIACDAWEAGKREAAEHILELWNEPWPIRQKSFITMLREYVESLK